MVDNAESGVATALRIGDDANGEEVVDLVEAALLANDFAVQGMQSLDAGFEFRRNAIFDELGANGVLYIFEEFFVNGSFVCDFFLQGEVRIGLEVAEREILKFAFDDGHAEAVGDRGVNVHGFARDAQLLGGLEKLEGAHIVDAVSKLDEDHADVVDHGEKHLADVLCLARLGSHDIETADLGDALDEAGDFVAKAFLETGKGKFGVFDDVVKECGGERGGVKTHVGEDVGDFEKMSDVRIAGTAELVAVAFSGDVESAADQPGIIRGAIGAELGEEFLKASVDLPLGAVAVEIEGYVGWRRHALVYDGSGRGERGPRRRARGAKGTKLKDVAWV
jgi:hypothetical protein